MGQRLFFFRWGSTSTRRHGIVWETKAVCCQCNMGRLRPLPAQPILGQHQRSSDQPLQQQHHGVCSSSSLSHDPTHANLIQEQQLRQHHQSGRKARDPPRQLAGCTGRWPNWRPFLRFRRCHPDSAAASSSPGGGVTETDHVKKFIHFPPLIMQQPVVPQPRHHAPMATSRW